MKIILNEDLPVDPRHGMTKGKELEVLRWNSYPGRSNVMWWVQGDGEQVGVLAKEATISDRSNPPRDEGLSE